MARETIKERRRRRMHADWRRGTGSQSENPENDPGYKAWEAACTAARRAFSRSYRAQAAADAAQEKEDRLLEVGRKLIKTGRKLIKDRKPQKNQE